MNRSYLKKLSRRFYLIPALLFCTVVSVLWLYYQPANKSTYPPSQPTITVSKNGDPIKPIPLQLELDEGAVELGRKLFHEPQLSGDNTVSCASCHSLNNGGIDGKARSVGIRGAVVDFNSPTVYNVGFNFRQFWDGRAKTLEEQAEGPVYSKNEMDSNWPEIVSKLEQSPEYVALFKKVYHDRINGTHIKSAIATFERSLYTPNSRFDRYLRGDKDALTIKEKKGYSLFKDYGCVSCHQGVNIGGNMFQSFGVMGNYFHDRGKLTKADLGRYNVTGKEEDRYVFKVPSLRNIALTEPYFHDGSVKTLSEAVAIMGKYQSGRPLSTQDIDYIVNFLKTLTGEYQGEHLWKNREK